MALRSGFVRRKNIHTFLRWQKRSMLPLQPKSVIAEPTVVYAELLLYLKTWVIVLLKLIQSAKKQIPCFALKWRLSVFRTCFRNGYQSVQQRIHRKLISVDCQSKGTFTGNWSLLLLLPVGVGENIILIILLLFCVICVFSCYRPLGLLLSKGAWTRDL